MSTVTVRGRVVTPDAVLDDGCVDIIDDRITAVRPATAGDPPGEGRWVLPGLIDVHCHGAAGASFSNPDDDHRAAIGHHWRAGTTTVVASTVSDAPDRMVDAVAALAGLVAAGDLAGIHIEVPFIAESCRGAHDPGALQPPDLALAERLVQAGDGGVAMMTIAPELPGATALAQFLEGANVIAAAGHTAADATTLHNFLTDSRTGHVTHLFNGMPIPHHRSGETAWTALRCAANGAARVELIADGVHVADAVAAAVIDSVGAAQVMFISDAMAATGMPDGSFELGPQTVMVREGRALLADGSSIAGGTSTIADIVARQVRAGLDPVRAVRCGATTAAHALGLTDVGALEAGRLADVVVLADDWSVGAVMRRGEWLE